ncbi:MAG TPA: zinc-binding dehydrogenase [Marmoricola sp.]|nr:zinc-binding dehydrogenase [Marmoricola sp.]
MRAAIITAHASPPAAADRPRPAPADREALVAVTAAPIVPLDLLCASGASYFGAPPVPYVPGVQGVGRVVYSSALPVGSRVWFPTSAGMRPGDGSMAELAVAPEEDLVVLPDGTDDALAAALGTSAIAAWMALTWRAALQAGEQVLVLGAGGVVGQVAVQLAKRLGARRVVGAARSGGARERARTAGADAVVALSDDDEPTTLASRMAEACDGPVDVVVDPLCGVPSTAAATLLGRRGRLVNFGSSAGEVASYSSAHLRSHTAAILGYTNNDITTGQRRDALQAVLRHSIETGLSVAHEVVALEDVSSAWARQAAGTADRRLVLRIS